MKKFFPALLALAAALFTGCFEIEDTLTVNADGSGHWKFRMTMGPKMVAMQSQNQGSLSLQGDILADERKLRTAVAKIKGVRLLSYSTRKHDGSITSQGEIAFDSIVDLYRSRAFKDQLNWEFKRVDNRLEARIAQGLLGSGDDNDITKQMEFASVKAMMMGMKVDRTLILPNAIISANGREESGRRARWLAELNQDTTEKQFAKMTKEKPVASCSIQGVTFKLPLGPAGALPIDLNEFSTDDASLKAQLAQVKIKPIRGTLMRNANYSDQKIFFGSAPFTVHTEISWPAGLKPSGWSRLTVTEGSDNTGRKLTRHGQPKPDEVKELRPKFNRENVSQLPIGLSDPARLAESFSVKGAVILHVPGTLKSIKVPDITKMVGQTLDHPDLKSFGLTVKSAGRANVQLAGKAPTDAIVDLKLESPDGTEEMKRFYLNRNQFRDEHRLQAGFSMGRKPVANPTLVIIIAGEIGQYAVPFEFKDLAVP